MLPDGLTRSHFELFWALVANWLPDRFLASGDKFATRVVSMYMLGAAFCCAVIAIEIAI